MPVETARARRPSKRVGQPPSCLDYSQLYGRQFAAEKPDLFDFSTPPIGSEVGYVYRQVNVMIGKLLNGYGGRQYKHQNSTIKFSTSLIEVQPGQKVETSFRFLTNGRNNEQRHFKFKLVQYSRRADLGFMDEHEELLEPVFDLTKNHPQLASFVSARMAGFAALHVSLTQGTKQLLSRTLPNF